MDVFPNYLDRNRLWQTQGLQRQLAAARVVIGGMGGLGWLIGSALVGLGVRRLDLFDPDTLEVVNFNRLWGCRRDQVGQPKVAVFAAIAREINPHLEIIAHTQSIPCPDFETSLQNADVVFGGFDQPEPRLAAQVLSLQAGVPYIDAGTAIAVDERQVAGFGQVFVSAATPAACIVCAGLRLDAIGYRGEGRGPQPSSGVLNGVLANLAVTAWIHSLLGQPVTPLTLFDWSRGSLQPHGVQSRPHCPICGNQPAWRHNREGSDAKS